MKDGSTDDNQNIADQAASRRHFLRCSGGATAATMIGWQLMTSPAQAGTGGSGGSAGSGTNPGSIPVGGSGGSGGSGN
ncbi:MAG: hypothetical protein ABF334_10350 [Akkermansiaceae bacterium]